LSGFSRLNERGGKWEGYWVSDPEMRERKNELRGRREIT